MMGFRVWSCKIVISGDAELPYGFDLLPRLAAIQAVEQETEVIACFSGWDCKLTDDELAQLIYQRSSGPNFEPLY